MGERGNEARTAFIVRVVTDRGERIGVSWDESEPCRPHVLEVVERADTKIVDHKTEEWSEKLDIPVMNNEEDWYLWDWDPLDAGAKCSAHRNGDEALKIRKSGECHV